MSRDDLGFAELDTESSHAVDWQRRLKDAKLSVARRTPTAAESLAAMFVLSYEATKTLPDTSVLRSEVHQLLGYGTESDDHECEITVVTSIATGVFLTRAEPDLARLETVTTVDRYINIDIVVEQVTSSARAQQWLALLRKVALTVTSVNDDKCYATDELERWERARKTNVPAWREGNFPPPGVYERLVSEILLRLDTVAWFQFLDRLPLAMLVEALLWAAKIEQDPTRLLDWIRHGLCHLAASKFAIAGEPENCLSYFVGDPEAFAGAVQSLSENGFQLSAIVDCARSCGIDTMRYLHLLLSARPELRAVKAIIEKVAALQSESSKNESNAPG
jgi:hypothetical protein